MVSARPPNLPMSRYTQRTSSSSLFLEIRTTSVSMMPALPTMPRPGSMIVSGIWLPKCLRSARKIDRPYCTTGGTSLRYRVGKPPPMLTMDRLIPRSAQSRNTVEAIASARLQAQTLGEVEHLDCHLRIAAELARQRPLGACAVIENAAEHLCAGSGTG